VSPPSPTDRAASRAARRWTVVSADGAVDVEISAGDEAPLREIRPALAAVLGTTVEGLWAGSRRLPDDLRLTAPELRHGAVLGLGRPGPRDAFLDRPSALELRFSGGPCSGTAIPLSLGRHVVGRSAGAGIRLDDPDVSRRHVEIAVRAGAVTVADLGSTNGTRLDDEPVAGEPRPWSAGTALRIGATTLHIAGPSGCPTPATTGAGGRVTLRPPERLAVPVDPIEIALPRAPEPPPARRLAWVAMALPAVGGVAMAWLLHTPAFLFFALLSPLLALGTWASDRLSGRRSGRRAAARYAADLAAAEAALVEAVRADVRALAAAHPDLAALTAAARRWSQPLWERQRADPDALVVRLGSGPGRTRVTRTDPDGSRHAATADDVPALLDLRCGGLGVIGPPDHARQALGGVLAQLAALLGPGELAPVLVTRAGFLGAWAWTRWLPHLDPRAVLVRPDEPSLDDDEALLRELTALLATRRPTVGATGASTPPPWSVVLLDGAVDARLALALREHRDAGVIVLTHGRSADALPAAVPAVLRLGGETGDRGELSLSGSEGLTGVTVDRLPPGIAAAFGRDLAALQPASSAHQLPREVRLLELSPAGGPAAAAEPLTGGWSRSRRSLRATLGRTAEGPFTLDLCRAGPHALIAGTTGSGKSELLQALVTSLALNHPPDRCSFLLVDYKGGAAFAEAVDLPHTVGLVTDLDAQSTTRALRSLGAELTRREQVLAAHGAADVADLPDDVTLARLVIVVDEFATLAEELPSFVPELVGIAQRGRSLGVHLVLATQRPGGVVSPEIRANCSLRICLRTADDGDSRDVIGIPDAARVPLDVPGRGYVRLGNGAPVAVQVARVSGTASAGSSEPIVRRWHWPAEPVREEAGRDGPSDLAVACRAIADRARAEGVDPPHRPWLPPLPALLRVEELRVHGAGAADGVLRLGLADRPDHQRQHPLELDLHRGGSWLAVGGPRSGRSTLLRTVLTEAVAAFEPERLHVHAIDVRGGALADEAAALPHTGTAIGRAEALRTVRLVERLAQEVAERRAAGSPAGRPALLLLVDGTEDVLELLDEADPGAGSAALLRLVRDGAAAGVTAVLTADRAVPGGRLAAVAEQRLVLPLPDRADYVLAGVPANAVPSSRPAGRALLGEEALECQLALPAAGRPVVGARPPAGGALCIPELPADPVLGLPPSDADGLVLPLGPGGDEGAVLGVDLARTGGLLVAGPPGSGRSSLLDALAAHLSAAGTPVLRVAPRISADPAWSWVRPDDRAGVQRWLGSLARRVGVVLADDLGAPADAPALAELPPMSDDGGAVLVAASTAGQLSAHYQGPVAALRRSRTGLLLSPQPGDADLLGVRLPRTPVPARPGSGWLVAGGSVQRVQVARRRSAEAGDAAN
jgi:S-DNA-T family DNA segregation ATPase FtsK/SpoIIIE